jgi:NAD(P)-dependent dehydrogenase (short-subunit alcohol dehydrogenase family)
MYSPAYYRGKSVIVTGGCKGIGRGITERFLELGSHVTICCRREPEHIPQVNGNQALFVAADVREPDQIDSVIAKTMEQFGNIDVLINNAGGSPFADTATTSPRFSGSIISLNLTAPLVFSQKSNKIMQEQANGGVIINIASVSGTRPSPGTAAYGAAKAGLLNLTQTLAVEWAPKVRINALVAGLIQTEQSHLHYGDEAGIQRVAQTVPMHRLGNANDIAQACMFLASPEASYITGAQLAIHGGGEIPAFLAAAKGSSGS